MLIVAACQKEIKPLCELGRRHFIVKNGLAFLGAGIGPVAAAFGLTHFLKDWRPQKIITVGTAGIVNPRYRIGEIVLAKSCATVSGAADVYPPKSKTTSYNTIKISEYSKYTGRIKRVAVFCPAEITRSEERRQVLLKKGYDVENLEAYAFAFVAGKFRIPITLYLGLTNRVGVGAHEAWRVNEGKVVKKLGELVRRSHLS